MGSRRRNTSALEQASPLGATSRLFLALVAGVCACVLSACGESHDDPAEEGVYSITTATAPVHPANPQGRYAGQLARCVYARQLEFNQLCALATLPLIGQETDTVTVEAIMDRVLVSHDWMADRFREILQTLPIESLDLLRAVTAVVIASDQPRADFSYATFALYIDGAALWVSDAERDTLAPAPAPPPSPGFDFEESGLLWLRDRVVNLLPTSAPRLIEDIRYAVAGTLYMEAGFAVDVVAPDAVRTLPRDIRPAQLYDLRSGQRIGEALWREYPLHSALLYQIADIDLEDKPVPATLRTDAPGVAAEYAANGAIFIRGFRRDRYDTADLIGVGALKHFLEVDAQIGILHPEPPSGGASIAAWGEYDRIADPLVKPRAQFVLEQAYPKITAWAEFFRALPAPTFSEPGTAWAFSGSGNLGGICDTNNPYNCPERPGRTK